MIIVIADVLYKIFFFLRLKRILLIFISADTPPDPAPPEVPPRGPSHHHPLLASQRRCIGSSRPSENPAALLYQDSNEDNHQQPSTNVFLSQGENCSYIFENITIFPP